MGPLMSCRGRPARYAEGRPRHLQLFVRRHDVNRDATAIHRDLRRVLSIQGFFEFDTENAESLIWRSTAHTFDEVDLRPEGIPAQTV